MPFSQSTAKHESISKTTFSKDRRIICEPPWDKEKEILKYAYLRYYNSEWSIHSFHGRMEEFNFPLCGAFFSMSADMADVVFMGLSRVLKQYLF